MHVDVEGSTALTTRAGDEAARKVLTETKRIVRERVEALGGREIDAVGDAMMMTFASTRAAIAGATAVQEELAARERERPDETLRVRIGLNVGEVLERDGTPFGAAVNAGARVMAKAAGGEILVSEMVRQLAGTVPGIQYRDRGRHTFKGFDEPWRLYELVWSGAPPKRARRRAAPSRRRLAIIAAALAALVAAGVAALFANRGSGSVKVGLTSLAVIDPDSSKVTHAIELGFKSNNLIAAGEGYVWVVDKDRSTLWRLDPRAHRLAGNFPLSVGRGDVPFGLAVGGGAV